MPTVAKLAPYEKFLKNHTTTCAIHIFSGDRHCSCGRDEAIKRMEALAARLAQAEEKTNYELIELAVNIIWESILIYIPNPPFSRTVIEHEIRGRIIQAWLAQKEAHIEPK